MKNRGTSRRLYLATLLIATGCLLVIGAGFRSVGLVTKPFKKSAEATARKLQSRVVTILPKLEIASVEQKSDDIVEVIIRNGYEKDVTAIAALIGGGKRSLRRDYSSAELEGHEKLPPGASDRFLYSITSLPGAAIVICAVVFSDLTSEGDRDELMGILDKRLGMKIQLGRIRPYLERLGKADSLLIRAELGKLKRVAESLPIETDDGSTMSEDLDFGLKHGRALILKYVSELETELENEKTETFYENGQLQTVRHSGYGNFQKSFARTKKYLTGYWSRL